jgi:hypothetical protein
MGTPPKTGLGELDPAWELRNRQLHPIQGHNYAMLFDPVTLLLGIPPRDITAKRKIAIRAQLFIATLFIIVKKK